MRRDGLSGSSTEGTINVDLSSDINSRRIVTNSVDSITDVGKSCQELTASEAMR